MITQIKLHQTKWAAYFVILQIMLKSPSKVKMIKKLSQLLDLSDNRINIKATTTEKLGFLGRQEGICAQAIVNIGVENNKY